MVILSKVIVALKTVTLYTICTLIECLHQLVIMCLLYNKGSLF